MNAVNTEPTMVHCPEQPTAALRESVAMDALTEFFSRAFATVAAEPQKQNVQLAGPPFALYRGMPTQTVDVEAGFSISGEFSDTKTVVGGALPDTDAFEAIHPGPYDTLDRTYTAIREGMKSAGRTPSDTMWEFYLNGPSTEPDPLKWQTRIVWPVA